MGLIDTGKVMLDRIAGCVEQLEQVESYKKIIAGGAIAILNEESPVIIPVSHDTEKAIKDLLLGYLDATVSEQRKFMTSLSGMVCNPEPEKEVAAPAAKEEEIPVVEEVKKGRAHIDPELVRREIAAGMTPREVMAMHYPELKADSIYYVMNKYGITWDKNRVALKNMCAKLIEHKAPAPPAEVKEDEHERKIPDAQSMYYTCQECGKKYTYTTFNASYREKAGRCGRTKRYFCSWGCKRAFERREGIPL